MAAAGDSAVVAAGGSALSSVPTLETLQRAVWTAAPSGQGSQCAAAAAVVAVAGVTVAVVPAAVVTAAGVSAAVDRQRMEHQAVVRMTTQLLLLVLLLHLHQRLQN